jgi:hypothetical protein
MSVESVLHARFAREKSEGALILLAGVVAAAAARGLEKPGSLRWR